MKFSQIIILSAVLLTGCFKSEEQPVYSNVEGVVLLNGDGVSGANVHIRSNFDPGGFITENFNENGISIEFNVQLEDLYTASLYRYGTDEILFTFFEDSLSVGVETIQISDSLLTNGLYFYQISRPSTAVAADMFIVNKPDSLLPETVPLTSTNGVGEFTLLNDYLALGRDFFTTAGGGFSITDSLQIIITNNEEILTIERVRVKPGQSNFFEITLD
ncbi:MAG TPA: hypothetical protein VFM80_13145 [Gracilimonas sp.]|uniref:hypothetical protein n=1 Tax=Gracilimonas sp. TaxID=1974203 RepID=UPI002D8A95C9|nr:hypothetical protein [Gracilimonas sp.]